MAKSVNLSGKKKMASSLVLHTHPELLYAIVGDKGTIIKSNDAFKEYVSHIRPQSIDQIFAVDVELEDMKVALEKAKAKTPDPQRFYCQVRNKSGVAKYIEWYVFFITGAFHYTGQRVVDSPSVTSLEYDRLLRLMEDFKHALEHDFGQPLTSLHGVLKIAMDSDNDNERKELIQTSEELTSKIIGIWRNVSDKIHRKLN